jgi:hypothetical protein
MRHRAIVNVGVGEWYPRGVDRLRNSILDLDVDCDLLTWRDEYPPGCPSHKEQPYAFKFAALEMALVKGYDAVIWCDCSVWFIKDPEDIFRYIEQKGYWIMSQGWQVSTWCSDTALHLLNIKREDYWDVPMISAAMFGLDLRTDIARQVLGYMRARVRDGSLRGPWRNEHGEASSDKRVLGHRHDQTAMSVVVHKLGLDIEWSPNYFEYKYDGVIPNPKCVALAQGM